MKNLIIVGTEALGLGGNGKVHPPTFFSAFNAALSRYGVVVETCQAVAEFEKTAS